MARIIGNGAFRVWVGRRPTHPKSPLPAEQKQTSNIGVNIHPKRFPTGFNLHEVEQQLMDEIEKLVRKSYPWCE
jgi:hypothetical protein